LSTRIHHLGGGEAELRAVAGGFHPLAGALRRELGAHADVRPDAEPPRHLQQQIELAVAVDDHDGMAPELLREERGFHVLDVFVAVQNQQALGIVEQRQPGSSSGFEPPRGPDRTAVRSAPALRPLDAAG
jgi:hypothetical protein